MSIDRIGIFDMACPDIAGEYRTQESLTEHDVQWPNDYQLASEFLKLTHARIGVPWPLMERERDTYTWDLLDERVGLLEELGIKIVLALAQFSWPSWLEDHSHPTLSAELAARFADYTEKVCIRYGDRIDALVPIIEIGTDAWSRAISGHWGPHQQGDTLLQRRMEESLLHAFNASAVVCRKHGVRVISHESATCFHLAVELDADEVGIDHYTHGGMGDIADVLCSWRNAFKLQGKCDPIFSIFERGAPESYDLTIGEHGSSEGYGNRLRDIAYYREQLECARAQGIALAKIGTFVIGNFWTDPCMTLNFPARECDRNAIIDLYRTPDGSLARRVQPVLAEAFNRAFA